MENQIQDIRKICCVGRHHLIGKILILLILVSALVWMCIDISNNIKTGRYIGKPLEAKNTITVSDKGEVYAKPDLAVTTFSVVTEAKTVAKAMSDNTAKMNGIIDSMKKQGIKESDLKTTNFSIYPRYEWLKAASELYPSGQRTLVGYEIQQSLEVKIRDMEKVGDIIQSATDSGANQIGDLNFTVEDEDALTAKAREEAIKKAKDKAKELASQLGVRLVRVSSFSEGSTTPRYYDYSYAQKEISISGSNEVPSPSIATGENKISVSVIITYEIN